MRRGLLDGRDVGEGVDGLSDDERVVREELVETSCTSGSPGRQPAATPGARGEPGRGRALSGTTRRSRRRETAVASEAVRTWSG